MSPELLILLRRLGVEAVGISIMASILTPFIFIFSRDWVFSLGIGVGIAVFVPFDYPTILRDLRKAWRSFKR